MSASENPLNRLAKFLAITAPDEDVVDAAIDNLRRLARQLSEERLNRQRLQVLSDMAVKRLSNIFGLIQPEPIEHDGKVFSFHPPDEHLREVWERLSAAIRAIPARGAMDNEVFEKAALWDKLQRAVSARYLTVRDYRSPPLFDLAREVKSLKEDEGGFHG